MPILLDCRACGKSFSFERKLREPAPEFCSDLCRFWSKVDKNGPVVRAELGPCWLWTAAVNKVTGYGAFGFEGRVVSTHRFAFFLDRGNWPEPCALHYCDMRRCVNPSHIWEGTQLENVEDMTTKGRARPMAGADNPSIMYPERVPRGAAHWMRRMPERAASGEALASPGELHHAAKLTDADVLEIRRRAAAGETQVALAKAFGISQPQANKIVTRHSWRHLP